MGPEDYPSGMPSFDHLVSSFTELREIVGQPGERTLLKERPGLDSHTRAFIARSPFLLMATSGVDGTCDVSPKGDAPGFVVVLDDRRLVIPERPGNKRLDGMRTCSPTRVSACCSSFPATLKRCAWLY